MDNLRRMSNSWNDGKVIDACSIFGMMDTSGRRFSGKDIIRAIANMHDRGNGLGGGFAVYGLYPEYADCYALHIMYLSNKGKIDVEEFLGRRFDIIAAEEVSIRETKSIVNPPLVWRYFVKVDRARLDGISEEEYVVKRVMEINTVIRDSFVFSSGRDMAVFKGVGYPEEIAEYFRLDEYEGYLWTAHGRFPTNSRGWWGGAHPFNILDWTVVHNGEISSYGINRRYLESFGYECTLETDTEVIAYAIDLLVRRHNLPINIAAEVFAPPLWEHIGRLSPEERETATMLRQVYGSLLMNGPFTVIIAHHGEMVGLTDRIRLRPLAVGTRGSMLYLSSEESAIRLVCPELDETWIPVGGQPIVGSLNAPVPTRRAPCAVREAVLV